MKALLSKIVCFLIVAVAVRASEVDWVKWVDQKNLQLRESMELPEQKKIAEIGSLVRGSAINRSSGARPYPEEISNIRMDFFERAQSALISIPGHAQHYDEEIRRMQKEVKDVGMTVGSRVTYDRYRALALNTLSYLPSPETVRVLGGFLWDEQDRLGSLRLDYYTNNELAIMALGRIGLQDTPRIDANGVIKSIDIERWQEWYKMVQSGQRTFSFVGQSVEYRFKPDGTWESFPVANPLDGAPPISANETKVRLVRREGLDSTRTVAKEHKWNVLPWIYIPTVFLGLALIALIGWRKRHDGI